MTEDKLRKRMEIDFGHLSIYQAGSIHRTKKDGSWYLYP